MLVQYTPHSRVRGALKSRHITAKILKRRELPQQLLAPGLPTTGHLKGGSQQPDTNFMWV